MITNIQSKTLKDVLKIKCERIGMSLVFKCSFCNRIHRHGACNSDFGAGDGWRQSHCLKYDGEYYIYEVR